MMQQQVSTKAKPSLQYVHSQLVQNRKPWPSLEGRLQPVHTEKGALKHCTTEMSAWNEEQRPSACLIKPWTSEYPGLSSSLVFYFISLLNNTILLFCLTVNGSCAWRQGSLSSSLAESKARAAMLGMPPLIPGRLQGPTMSPDPKALYIISTPAPLVPRPHLSHSLRKGTRRVSQHEHSH